MYVCVSDPTVSICAPCYRQHEQFGYCQAGTSGLLTDDDSAVIGLPGPYTWRGTVFAVNISDSFLHRDKTQYLGPVTAPTSPVDKYSYLGTACLYLSGVGWDLMLPMDLVVCCFGVWIVICAL